MPAVFARHQGKVLAKSGAQKLEGDLQVGAMVVVVEFPTAEHAQAWYTDPEHEHLKQLRRTGADFDLILVNGVWMRAVWRPFKISKHASPSRILDLGLQASKPQSPGCNGFHLLRRMASMNDTMRRNTPAAIGVLLIAGYGLAA